MWCRAWCWGSTVSLSSVPMSAPHGPLAHPSSRDHSDPTGGPGPCLGAVLAQRSTMSWVVCELLSPGATGAVRSAESGSRETRMGSSDSVSRPRPAGPQQRLTFPRLKLPHFTLDGAPEEHSAHSAAPCGQSSCLWRDR